jgi:hypothetical protein
MGIRYFAHAVSPRQIAQSRECPRGCFEHEDLWENWDLDDEPTLDLDKCYPELQWLLGGDVPRPSYALVEGGVTPDGYGWQSFRRMLDVDETRRVADDLDDLLANVVATDLPGCRFGGPHHCLATNLPRAREFARRVADAGFGIHFRIG